MRKNSVVILAAGGGTRMGSAKQLLEYQGKPLIRHAVDVALASRAERVFVVVGSHAGEVRTALDGLDVSIVENARWEEGMGTSIQAGIGAADAAGLDGVILTLADLPLVTPEILDRLMLEHEETGKPIVASQYSGTVGVPVYFTREFYPQLLALEPKQGCKGVILAHAGQAVRLDCPEAAMDIDTPADYARLKN